MDTLDVLIQTSYNQSACNLFYFHTNRVLYNINTTNEATSKNLII